MDCSSLVTPLSLSSQTRIQPYHHKIPPRHVLFLKELNRHLSTNPSPLQKSLYFPSKFQSRHPLLISKLPPISSFIQSRLLQTPTSNHFKIQCSNTPKTNFLKTVAEKLAVMIVGSLLFMGSFGCKPVLAFSNAEKITSSSPMEEKKKPQSGKRCEEEMYTRLLEKNPKDVKALKVLVYAKMRKGKTKEAVEYVERLIKIEPNEVEWRLLEALCYEMMGSLSKAKRLFKEILEERPLLLRALHGLAMVMHKNLEGPVVFEMLNEALELACSEKRVTEERNIRILIGQMHVVKGDLEEGLKKFQDLVNLDPRDFRPYLCQGIIYSLLDKKLEAEEQFAIYQRLVPHEFPQRGFLDDVVMEAKTESRERLTKGFRDEFSNRNMRTT